MKTFTTKVIAGLVSAFALTASWTTAAAQGEPIKWRYYTAHTTDRDVFKFEQDWANMVTEASNGRLEVKVFPGGSLGFKVGDMLGALKNGLVETSYIYAGYYGRTEPALPLVLPQMVFNTRKEFLDILPEVYKTYSDVYKQWGVKVASMWPTVTCHIAVIGKEKFNTLDSLQGKRVRVWEAQQVNSLKGVGVVGTVVPQNDIYLSFKTGMIDAVIHYPDALKVLSLAEDAKYFSLLQPVPVVQGIGISQRAFDALPQDLQKVVEEASKKHSEKYSSSESDCAAEAEHIKWAEENGVKRLPDFSAEDRQRLSDAAVESWRARAEQVGGKALEVQKRMENALLELREQ
jgi:TRAP-type C4-dicarboxylate transport system substrate-binding protein